MGKVVTEGRKVSAMYQKSPFLFQPHCTLRSWLRISLSVTIDDFTEIHCDSWKNSKLYSKIDSYFSQVSTVSWPFSCLDEDHFRLLKCSLASTCQRPISVCSLNSMGRCPQQMLDVLTLQCFFDCRGNVVSSCNDALRNYNGGSLGGRVTFGMLLYGGFERAILVSHVARYLFGYQVVEWECESEEQKPRYAWKSSAHGFLKLKFRSPLPSTTFYRQQYSPYPVNL